MKRPLAFALVCLAGCQSDWREMAVYDAEANVRQQINDSSVQFMHVQFTGDRQTGQTCGYYSRSNMSGATDHVRFIDFIDGAGGQNPYIDDPSAPYPVNKSDFAANWQTQCLDLGYSINQN